MRRTGWFARNRGPWALLRSKKRVWVDEAGGSYTKAGRAVIEERVGALCDSAASSEEQHGGRANGARASGLVSIKQLGHEELR